MIDKLTRAKLGECATNCDFKVAEMTFNGHTTILIRSHFTCMVTDGYLSDDDDDDDVLRSGGRRSSSGECGTQSSVVPAQQPRP